jgi:hypothetical protein
MSARRFIRRLATEAVNALLFVVVLCVAWLVVLVIGE